MTFEVTVLGTSSALPAHYRHPSAQLVNHNHTYLLFDCGEGTQMQLQRFGLKRSKIEHIFISHLHGDHYFGLPGLLTTLNLLRHEKPLHLYGPPALETILNTQFQASALQLQLDLHFHPIPMDSPNILVDNEAVTIYSLPLQHRIACVGFVVAEKERERKYNPKAGHEYGVPVEVIDAIKKGADYTQPDGTIIPNRLLTHDPLPPRKYAYFTDTLPLTNWDKYLQGVDLLYHEATFLQEHAERAAHTHHTTALQAAQLANRNRVSQLLIGHYSAKYTDLAPLLEEAQSIFPNTQLAMEGDTYAIG